MIDIHEEEFDEETGVLDSRITLYNAKKSDVNMHISKYINTKNFSNLSYYYHESLGSKISVNGVDNGDTTYTFKIKVQYSKIDVNVEFVDKFD